MLCKDLKLNISLHFQYYRIEKITTIFFYIKQGLRLGGAIFFYVHEIEGVAPGREIRAHS